jgi:S-adenosylmethionine:tRNA ribosyltransferase-isomerase
VRFVISRGLCPHRKTGAYEHRAFSDIGNYLVSGDLLVLNNTKVFPCRLMSRKPGGGKAEIFLLEERSLNVWNALVKGSLPVGKTVSLEANIKAEIIADNDDGTRDVRFHGSADIRSMLPEIGKTPLPPYIKREPQRRTASYQTVYAAREGAVAAPTPACILP